MNKCLGNLLLFSLSHRPFLSTGEYIKCRSFCKKKIVFMLTMTHGNMLIQSVHLCVAG